MKRIISVILTVLMLFTLVFAAGCDSDSNGGKASGGSSDKVISDVKGTVTLAVPNWNIIDMQEHIARFSAIYPNVTVNISGFDGDPQTHLTAQASANTLPDVLWGDWGSLPFSVSQGWVKPLNEFLEKDDESKYIPQTLLNDATYGGNIYALPNGIQFNCIVINKTLVEELNLDMPDYDWTVEEFTDFIKSGATTTTAGIEILAGIDEHLTAINNDGVGVDGYDFEKKSFNMASTWIDGVNLFRELRVTPNVEAWVSRNAIDANNVTDYEKKFGTSDLDDSAAAFKTGKVLTLFGGTWDDSWLRYMSFDWELYPMPQKEDGSVRMPVHANHTFMLNTCKDTDAAFALIKFLTYGLDGNNALMDIYEDKDATDVTSGYLWYFPSTTHPDIEKRMQENEYITEGSIYMYTHMDNTYRGDMNKIIPGWDQVFNELVGPKGNEVRDGSREGAAVAAEIDREATKQIQNYWTDFENKLSK